MKTYISKCLNDTNSIAKDISEQLVAGDIVLLNGDLGAGKTYLVKQVVKSFGEAETTVTSPTFTIVNSYHVKNQTIYHFDFYRIKSIEELYGIGIEEYLYSDAICFIEWPERAMELFDSDQNIKTITIEKLSDLERKITLKEGL